MSTDKRTAWNSTLAPGKPMERTSRLERSGPIPPVSRERKKKRADAGEVYGDFHRWCATRPCAIAKVPGSGCTGVVAGHHRKTVGAGGKDASNEVPLCTKHHTEVHTMGETRFEAKYHGIDMDLEEARVWGEYCTETIP